MNEIWRSIEGFEGYYEVSNHGRVRSLDRHIIRHYKSHDKLTTWKGRIMALHLRTDGYPFVDLYKEHKRYSLVVHRLVAIAFVPNPNNRPEVDHINTIRTDARACNLRWVNRSENNLNPITNKRMSDASKGRGCKPILQFNKEGDLIASFKSIREASKSTGYHVSTISGNAKGKHESLKYIWKYGSL
jgi:hypothetical protein